jgi:hypothetical protein
VYLLDNGELLRSCVDSSTGFNAGGRGGRVERIAWDGTVLWNYLLADSTKRQHHDTIMLPSGNYIAIVWEKKTLAEATAAGRNPATLTDSEIWPDALYEIQPQGATGGTVVWSWHAWDHLIQNFDVTKANYGNPADHPEKIDVNYPPGNTVGDWEHCNGLDYNADLDQIVLSNHHNGEIWVINHAPAASGDLMYRWGNPAAYGMGTPADQKLFGQHNPNWIRAGLNGAGHILIYNNGFNRPAGAYSEVDEIDTPLQGDGTYARAAGQPWGPAVPFWMCDMVDGARFYSSIISSAQRLPNGNTLVCVGNGPSYFTEVDTSCHSVWSYVTPFPPGGNTAVFRGIRVGPFDDRLKGHLWCVADFNNDGDVGTDADIDAFFRCLGGDCCASCGSADYNGDGDLGTDADIEAFFRVLGGGAC